MKDIIGTTRSLCPICLKQIPAERVVRDQEVFLEKTCPEHGFFSTVIWRDVTTFKQWVGVEPLLKETENTHCPSHCGICDAHLQGTCCTLYEVTKRCNLHCRFCFADPKGGKTLTIKQIKADILEISRKGQTTLQLSGGEPTMRDDLPEIIRYAKECGIKYVQLNSNGIRIGEDKSYLEALVKAGLSFVFMQFDGTKDSINIHLRGIPLFKEKLQAIKNCTEFKIGVTLVPTLVECINTDEIGNILQFAITHSPTVRGVHFQPVSFFGRYPSPPKNADRYTLDMLLCAINQQTQGLISMENFEPSHCDHPLCGFHGSFIVLSGGVLQPLTKRSTGCCCQTTAEQNREYIGRRWQRCETKADIKPAEGLENFDEFLSRANSHAFTVTAMAFQDCYNIDIQRLRRCSLHVYDNGRLMPFCAAYLTPVHKF